MTLIFSKLPKYTSILEIKTIHINQKIKSVGKVETQEEEDRRLQLIIATQICINMLTRDKQIIIKYCYMEGGWESIARMC